MRYALRATRYALRAAGEGSSGNLSGEGTGAEVSPALQNTFREMWPRLEPALLEELEKQMASKAATLEKFLGERAAAESADVSAILAELSRSIRAEIEREPPQQLALWSSAEQEQLRRNREALRRRLELIPGEIERETAAIAARYQNPQPRIFPAAVEFLVPGSVRG